MASGYKHLTESEIDRIFQVYDETQSTRITADRLGLSIQRVCHHLKKHGIEMTGYRRSACLDNFDLVVQLAQEGFSLSEIGRRVGTTHHRVKEFLARYDIDYQPVGQSGRYNPNWRGGRVIDKDGAILIHSPNHPHATRHGYVREHRLVMEHHTGRYLTSEEVVHHIDGDNQNNDIDNLVLYPNNGAHLADTLAGCVPNWTPQGRARILVAIRRPRGQRRKSSPEP